jgi:hypothetical protein
MADPSLLSILIIVAGAVLLTAVVRAVGTSTCRVVWTSCWCPLQKRHVTVGFRLLAAFGDVESTGTSMRR